ncbi:MAG: phosphate acyltransferase [Chlamydiae bacterium CG10_big_fil_rev_8_21_14_0_10_35_9]|nr:MAG: phosphate acyltransferase [Chlamydiae bacterium CG10_big_fil_rev_8_21_14_0_10_35_9]
MNLPLRIGVDLMGSDNSPETLLDAVCEFASLRKSTHFYLFAKEQLEKKLPNTPNIHFIIAKQSIEMNENPLLAIRRKKDSSICIGMHHLKSNNIDAFISAGNTGALVTAAKTILGMQPSILRPALLATVPTKERPLAVLDVGANIELKPIHLMQFAQMGVAYLKEKGIERPRVGLLNIGAEKLKGTSLLQEAFVMLSKLDETHHFTFVGNIEGKEVFQGVVDVLITDGFTGNVFLKTAEGIASLILDRLQENISKDIFNNLQSQLNDLQKHLHYTEYPGAILCGVNGLVVKCHGYSSPDAFVKGIDGIIQNKLLLQ